MRIVQNNGALGIITVPESKEKFEWLVGYFSKIRSYVDDGIDRRKGVLLGGPVGCLKTTSMEIIADLAGVNNAFELVSTADVVAEFNRSGEDSHRQPIGGENSLDKYRQHKEYCFDDLGEESDGKHYGAAMNVMKEVILRRYVLWKAHGVRTHFTTNSEPKELEKMYGARAYDRLIHMSTKCFIPKGTGFRDKSMPIPRKPKTKHAAKSAEQKPATPVSALTEAERKAILDKTNKMLTDTNNKLRAKL